MNEFDFAWLNLETQNIQDVNSLKLELKFRLKLNDETFHFKIECKN